MSDLMNISFNELKRNARKDLAGLKEIKLSLLGDSSTQMLNIALKGMAVEYGYKLTIWEADYDQLDLQIFDEGSELYQSEPDIVFIFRSFKKFQKSFYKKNIEAKPGFHKYFLEEINGQYNRIKEKFPKCKVIYGNIPEENDGIFGNYSNKTAHSLLYQVRKVNTGLMELSMELKDLFPCDVAALFAQHGRSFSHSEAVYINSDIVHSLDFNTKLSKHALDIIAALQGRFKKCLILDLDNTTWGGIIGDDGIENIQVGDLGVGKAFTELQLWARQLKERGIILAICSKNNEETAKDPFINHPDMVLRLEDIAVFMANWETKVDNIRHIQEILNIGFDSMVFLDDNPFERNIVRENIPQITVPELPENPEEYLGFLQAQNLFETASFSLNDADRTGQYQKEAERASFSKSFANEDDFLASLCMTSDVQAFNKFNTPRVAQLSQRSNQFNLRTVRYTEGEIENISADKNYITASFTLDDKFGNNGLIGIIVMKQETKDTLFIENWIMSCRVLKRGMENFMLNHIVETAGIHQFSQIKAEYLPTAKNSMVKDHYKNLGFTEEDGIWALDIKKFENLKTFITKK
ncbi:MAG: HAD-IIIC family phosphatase [Ferruginibacter sp.]